MITQWFLGVAILLWGPPFADLSPREWPPVRPGIWQLRDEWTAKNGRPQAGNYQMNQCLDQKGMFMAYLGEGIIERGGSRHESTRIVPSTFRIIAEWMVRGVGVARTESIVEMIDETSFRMEMRHYEGTKKYHVAVTGRWISGCGEEGK